MRKLAMGGLIVLASACGSNEGAVIQPPVPETAPTPPELTTTSTEAATTTTTEPATTTTTEAPVTTTTVLLREQATTTVVRRTASGDCGGTLPPCSVMQRESRGSLTVYNYEGSGASGKWQIMPSTWNGYGGYANAADAPESVQDAKARLLWNNGLGCQHWDAC